ncbi:MAG: nucleotidyl transferase AbiEii/AbiGii toxin family protein [Proteobacteria bacterium]|nr:nucleotidyl transferase AbiEii/AbiGii toxin family protein [Pseudomonadota bacterium]
MKKKVSGNIPASVRQRLLNKARNDGRSFNELLQYFAMERFLYRLSKSRHVDGFVLKGALMLRAWRSPEFRPTMDIDMLGRISNDEAVILGLIEDILSTDVDPDGLDFDVASIRAERITEDADYEGIRIRFRGALGTARIAIQIDIGFGDVVFPKPESLELPTMLDYPPPRLWGYSRESTIAEKFEAMLKLRRLNSRMKDFYDIWLLSRRFDFSGETLTSAIKLTLEQRGTDIPDEIEAFSKDFIEAKQIQWSAFRRRIQQEHVPDEFEEVVSTIGTLLTPIAEAIRNGASVPSAWSAPGPWS